MTKHRRRITTYACSTCTATVALAVRGAAWCTRCGRKMHETTTKPTPRTPHDGR